MYLSAIWVTISIVHSAEIAAEIDSVSFLTSTPNFSLSGYYLAVASQLTEESELLLASALLLRGRA